MKFQQIYQQNRPIISVELFPPRTEKGWSNLYKRLNVLQKFPLDYVTVTYGAGGSTRERTLELVAAIKNSAKKVSVPHYTSIGASPHSVQAFVDAAIAQGVENIIALRGDIPQNDPNFHVPADGFRYGNELVAFIKNYTNQLDIAVGGYPEMHPEATNMETDILNLKRKVDAGAAVVITQLFFDNSHYYRFQELAHKAGITIPIVPGILPIIKLSQIERITALCGATIPQTLRTALAKHEDGSDAQRAVGLEHAINQMRDLLAQGVPGVHIYSLNSWETVSGLLAGIDMA